MGWSPGEGGSSSSKARAGRLGSTSGISDHPSRGVDPAGRSLLEPVDLAHGIRRLTRVEVRVGDVVQTVRYGVTKHRVTLDAYAATGANR